MKRITIEWDGESYEFAPSHDLYMRIESKEGVTLNRLAVLLERAISGGEEAAVELPMSHISWALYCVLKHCNVGVRTPLEVQHSIAKATNYVEVIFELFAEFYGAMPEKPLKKKPQQVERQGPPKMKRRKRRSPR